MTSHLLHGALAALACALLPACGNQYMLQRNELSTQRLPDDRVTITTSFMCLEMTGDPCPDHWSVYARWTDVREPVSGDAAPPPDAGTNGSDAGADTEECSTEVSARAEYYHEPAFDQVKVTTSYLGDHQTRTFTITSSKPIPRGVCFQLNWG